MFVELISTALQYASIPVTDGQTQRWVCQYFVADEQVRRGNQYVITAEVPVRNDTQNNVEFASIAMVSASISSNLDLSLPLSRSPINGANITPSAHYGIHSKQWFYEATISDETRGTLYFSVWARARCSIPSGQLTGQAGQGFMRVLKIQKVGL